jgi:hypothetical protein
MARSAERPIARGATESFNERLPAPVGNLPIFDSLTRVPNASSVTNLPSTIGGPVLGQVTGAGPGRHRAPRADVVPGAVSRAKPVVDHVSGYREGLRLDPSINPAAAGDLPIFGAVLRQASTRHSNSLPVPRDLLA